MEQAKKQFNITNKLKRYTIYPLLAMGVLWGGLSSQSYADQPEAEQLEEMLNVKVIGKLTQADKEEALKAFKENAKAAHFPKEIINLVSLETISDYELYKNYRLMYCKNGMYITLFKNKNGELNSFPAINLYEITPEDIAEPLPPLSNGINTVTRKPYFTVPKGLGSKMSDDEKKYFRTLLKVMNTNFGALMQLYTLDQKKINDNKYAGKVADENVFYFGEGYEKLEQGLDETEKILRRQLGFVVNGAVNILKAGGRLSVGVTDCTGWTIHAIKMKSNDTVPIVVFNGAKAVAGSLPYYRRNQITAKRRYLKEFQKNFHALMREHGVEPGTSIKDKSLTTDAQRIIAGIGNAFDNYQNALTKTGALNNTGPAEKKSDIKNLDKYTFNENQNPPIKGVTKDSMERSSISQKRSSISQKRSSISHERGIQ